MNGTSGVAGLLFFQKGVRFPSPPASECAGYIIKYTFYPGKTVTLPPCASGHAGKVLLLLLVPRTLVV